MAELIFKGEAVGADDTGSDFGASLADVTLAPGSGVVVVVGLRGSALSAFDLTDGYWNGIGLNIDKKQYNAGPTIGTVILSLPAVAGGMGSVDLNFANAEGCVVCFKVFEVPGGFVSWLDVVAGATGTSTTPSSGATAATAQENELVIGGVTMNAATALGGSWDGGLVDTGEVSASDVPGACMLGVAHRFVTGVGAYAASKTGTRSALWTAAVATYKVSAPDLLVRDGSIGDDVIAAGPATTSFKDAWGSEFTRRAFLIKITLTEPVTQVIRLTNFDGGLFTPDGQYWQGVMLSMGSIHEPGGYMTPGPNPAYYDFTVDNAELAECAPGKTLAHLLSASVFQGARVDLYDWSPSFTSFGDAYSPFQNGVIDRHPVVAEDQAVQFFVVQRAGWNVSVPDKRITKGRYGPNLPEGSDGAYEPIALGDHRTMKMREPTWSSPYGEKRWLEDMGVNEPKLPGVAIDKGTGTDPIKLLACGHAVSEINTVNGCRCQIRGGGQLDSMVEHTLATAFNGASGSGVTIADEVLRAYAAIVPVDVRVTGSNKNTAQDPKLAYDALDEQTPAIVDLDGGKGRLQLILPNVSALGDIEVVDVVLAYKTTAGTGDCTARPTDPDTGALGSAVNVPASTTPTHVAGTWDSAYWSRNWEFGGTSTHAKIDLLVTGPSSQKLYVYRATVRVKHRPGLTLLQGGGHTGLQGVIDQIFGRGPLPPVAGLPGPLGLPGGIVPGSRGVPGGLYEQRSPFFFNLVGPVDESDGRWTGTNAALIERHTDMVRWLLANKGDEDRDAKFETGAGALGSFADARNAMKTMEGTDHAASYYANRAEDLMQTIRRFGEEALCEFELDPADDKWHALPWVRQPAVTYGKLYRDDFESLSVNVLSRTQVVQAVKLDYAISPGSGRYLFSTIVDPDTSGMGFEYGTEADQQLLVTSSNNTLKFTPDGSTVRTATFAIKEYLSGLELAQEIYTRMGNADFFTWAVGYGMAIGNSFNDLITVIVGGNTFVATLRPYEYTPDNAAREATFQLNAAGTGITWTVTYDHATRKYTFAATGAFTLVLTSVVRNALPAFGFALGTNITDSSAPYSQVGAYKRNQEHFWIATTNAAGTLRWTDALTTCEALIGSVDAADSTVGGWLAGRRRGVRQARARASAVRLYGAKLDGTPKRVRVLERQLSTVRDSYVAADDRDRLLDFQVRPPVEILAVSRKMRDIKRGHTFELDAASIDPWAPYTVPGSNGSHEGRVYRVLEVERQPGPANWSNRVLACEMDSPAPVAAGTPGGGAIFAVYRDNGSQVFVQKLNINGQNAWGAPVQVSNNVTSVTTLNHVAIPDGLGGCYVAWNDDQGVGTHDDVKLVRLNPNGTLATGWTSGGTAVCTEATAGNNKSGISLCLDGAGGVIVAWCDLRNSGIGQAYAQRFNGSGAAQWTANGVRVFGTTTNNNTDTGILPDGFGGAYIVTKSGPNIHGFRIDSAGALMTGWTATTGVLLHTTGVFGGFDSFSITSDAAGGLYCAAAANTTIALTRATPAGGIVSGFPVANIASTAAGNASMDKAVIVPDGAGGVLVGWAQENTSPATTTALFVQRVSAAGAVLFATGGVRVTTDHALSEVFGYKFNAYADGSGGMVMSWEGGNPSGAGAQNIYAQRVSSGGSKLWGNDGLQVTNLGLNASDARIVGLGDGSAWIAWLDSRDSGNDDGYVQLVNANGIVQLTANGVRIVDGNLAGQPVRIAHPTTAPA